MPGLPWIATPFLSVVVVIAASLMLGLPTMRLRTYYLAMTTIGFGEIIRLIIVHWEPVTGGTSGLRAIPGISILGFGPEGQAQHYYILAAALAMAMLGAVYAGLAGCLYASSIRFISPDSFSGTQAILLMTMLIVGGMGSIVGCVVGAVALTILPEALRFLGQWYLVLYGLGVIAVIVLAPGVLASLASLSQLRRASVR